MTTLTLPAADVDALEFDIPCDAHKCEASASWVLVTECCGDTVLVCDRHHDWARMRLISSVWECAGCLRLFPLGHSFTEHCVRVERIK